jgi:hypothetical protein
MNSKNVPLVNGGVMTLINSQLAGKITFNCVHFSTDPNQGDIPTIARLLLAAAISQGGSIRITTQINGTTDAITFNGVTAESVPPYMIAGNDVVTIPVTFNYQSWVLA